MPLTPSAAPPPYAELHCRSNFSFLTGASHPEELVQRAVQLGYSALAITDECSVAGVVRAHLAAKEDGRRLHLIVGSEMQLTQPDGDQPFARLVLLAMSRRGYGNLVQWITVARRRAGKGRYLAHPGDVEGCVPVAPELAGLSDCLALLVPDPSADFETLFARAVWLKTWFQERAFIALELLHRADEVELVDRVQRVAQLTDVPIVAAGDVLMHVRSRKPLQDTLTAVRLAMPLAQCGHALAPNAEQHLRSRTRLAALYRPEWLARTLELAGQCRFSLDELRYEYPREIVPDGHTPTSYLRQLTFEGAQRRWPDGLPAKVGQQIEHELALIARLAYEPYFLTVADIVRWARSQDILCQGRGSAANSAVCYCLGITEVDPDKQSLLFERFISAERHEPPDIDVDFEHQRREEVIQYIYRKYGRHRAALTAVVISYRPRSAIRDVGRALGIDLQRIDAVSKSQQWYDGRRVDVERLRENGFDPASPIVARWIELTEALIGFPRHLSQHPGGFVIARDHLAQLVPVENATMEKRSVVQWDKDDLDALGLLKVDILALGMLSALRRSFAFIGAKLGRPQGQPFSMQDIPHEDAATYEMACRADTVGVFQIESRAQMSMLPRLQPRKFYDLVIQVAIVRPGPIQGGMVHPYLRRRSGEEAADYPSDEVRQALERTKGVPIFQEQAMQLAILAADFTPGEADQLRRAMAAWKRRGGLGPFEQRLVGRMVEKGYTREYAERIFRQIEGFGEYGFPESHAAGFAWLAYVSCWIKCHHPDAFLAGLLNSQPMGFYAPAQLVRDARSHGVEVRAVDVGVSGVQSTLETAPLPCRTRSGLQAGTARRARRMRLESPVSPPTLSQREREQTQRLSRTAQEQTPRLSQTVEEQIPGRSCRARELEPSPSGRGQGEGAVDKNTPSLRPTPLHAVRLGLDRIAGLSAQAAQRIVQARAQAAFTDVEDLARRAALTAQELKLLAQADALCHLGGHRHQAAWAVAGIDARPTDMLRATRFHEAPVALDAPGEAEDMQADYRALGLTLARHPLALLRPQLDAFKVQPGAVLRGYPDGRLARASGLVTHRQRPGTAKGTVFVTLEDETGSINVIVWPRVAEQQRRALLAASLLTVYGTWQRQGEVMHLVANRLVDHSALLNGLVSRSRDFR